MWKHHARFERVQAGGRPPGQRQSGSAFGMSLTVRKDDFRILKGALKSFTRTADSGRLVTCAFCPECGTRIYHEPHYRKDSVNIKPLWDSYQTGLPVQWTRVHDLPDFAYFDHSAHVVRGVSCVECHGRVDKMIEVYQQEPLSMKWCLDCHREPDASLRNPNLVTQLGWGFDREHAQRVEEGARWREFNNLMPSQDCSICHR